MVASVEDRVIRACRWCCLHDFLVRSFEHFPFVVANLIDRHVVPSRREREKDASMIPKGTRLTIHPSM